MVSAKLNLLFHNLKTNVYFIKYISFRKLYLSEMNRNPTKYTTKFVPELEDKFESGDLKYKLHPGIRKSKCISIPEKLKDAAVHILSLHQEKNIQLDSLKFDRQLYSKRLPIEYAELQMRTREILKKMNVPITEENAEPELSEAQQKELKGRLNCETNRWKLTRYTDYTCLLYMVARLSANYACIHKVFSEISLDLPVFQPKSFFDFGSGIGTAMWAAHSFWGISIKEYFCIDTSAEMNSLCQLLLQGGKEEENMFLKEVYFRQFLPGSDKLKYDLVVSAFSLLELPSAQERIRVIDTLWHKTNDLLIIIEHGSNAGFSAVLDARDYIIKLQAKAGDNASVHVIAPCPHKIKCPRFGGNWPCNFPTSYYPFYPDKECSTFKKDLFSYVVLKRGPLNVKTNSLPRIVQPTIKKSKMALCRMCCSDGKLHEVIFTKAKHGKNAYQCAKYCSHGDLLPFEVIPKELKTENEENDVK